MTIKEFIETLEKHPNPDAEIIWKINTENPDDEEKDMVAQLEIFGEDSFYHSFIEMFLTPKNKN